MDTSGRPLRPFDLVVLVAAPAVTGEALEPDYDPVRPSVGGHGAAVDVISRLEVNR